MANVALYLIGSGGRHYRFEISEAFEEQDIIEAAADQLTAHKGNRMLMGRNAAVYDAMTMLTRMVLRVSDRIAAGAAD